MSASKRAKLEMVDLDENYREIERNQETSELVEVTLDVMNHGIHSFQRGLYSTIAGLKDELRKRLDQELPDLENNRLLILFNQTRFDDTTTLDHIREQFEVTEQLDMMAVVLDRPEIKTEAHTVVHTTRVLNNNVRECMSSTIIGNVDAKDRRRHNEPEFITPNEPTMYDFGLVTEELAKSFDLAAQAHKKLASCLREIEEEGHNDLPTEEKVEVLNRSRQTIQNTLDGNRYMCPMLKNYSRILTKLGDDSLLKNLDVLQLGN